MRLRHRSALHVSVVTVVLCLLGHSSLSDSAPHPHRRFRVAIDHSSFGEFWSFTDELLKEFADLAHHAPCSHMCDLVGNVKDADLLVLPGHKVYPNTTVFLPRRDGVIRLGVESTDNVQVALVCTEPFCHTWTTIAPEERRKRRVITIGYHELNDYWLPFSCRRWLRLMHTADGAKPPNLATRQDGGSGATAAAFISNCWARERAAFLHDLMEHTSVHSYGTCHHNAELPSESYDDSCEPEEDEEEKIPGQEISRQEDSRDMELHLEHKRHSPVGFFNRKITQIRRSKYPFVLAIENFKFSGYVSEKTAHAVDGGAIPIVYGGEDAGYLLGSIPKLDVRQLVNSNATRLTAFQREVNASGRARVMARVVGEEIDRILADPSETLRLWDKAFGVDRADEGLWQSPIGRQCSALDASETVFSITHRRRSPTALAASSSGHWVDQQKEAAESENNGRNSNNPLEQIRLKIDHSDMFSLDELYCAACTSAHQIAAASFVFSGCFEDVGEKGLEANSEYLTWYDEPLDWSECKHKAMTSAAAFFVVTRGPRSRSVTQQSSNPGGGEGVGVVEDDDDRDPIWCATPHLGGQGAMPPLLAAAFMSHQIRTSDVSCAASTDAEERPLGGATSMAVYSIATVYQYAGCFAHHTQSLVQYWHTPGIDWKACSQLAAANHVLWFAMEFPQGYPQQGVASCGIFGKYAGEGQIDDAHCNGEPDSEGRPVGGRSAMAVYQVSPLGQ